MIPSVLAQQVRRGVEDFLHTTFPISTPFFHGLLDRLFAEEGGVFKGPYLSIQLPLRQSTSGPDFFPDVPLRFKPYVHQERVFQRLSGTKPRSTIVATGTGSGKTESFLHPILDYCHKHRGEPGIKAILIYPMNALASDQALRLARTIWHNPNLKGHVTAGLFVGQSEREPHTRMGEDYIITNKDTLRLMPPDILLTNYKMLDYLLVRPRDFPLWKDNGSETLRYVVVDELHTFDGAQGADLGCLVRRLKNRLATPPGFLCCVGTSATLGSDTEQHALRDYAATTFGEAFDADAIITESRLSAGEFLEHSLISRVDIVPPDKALDLAPESYESYPAYIRGQYQCWFDETLPQDTFADAFDAPGWRVTLGRQLKEHRFFQNLLKVLGGKVRRYEDILLALEKVTPELRQADPAYRENLLNSLLALVSEALVWVAESPQDRAAAEANSTKRPTAAFLHVRLQHWMRELRRMVCDVRPTPQLRFADDLTDEQRKRHLPIVHCRECGSTGWAGLRKPTDNSIQADLQSFYIGFFRNDAKVTFLFPEAGDVRAQKLDGNVYHLCGACLGLTTRPEVKTCPTCDHDELIRVFVPNSRTRRQQRVEGTHDCPYCGAAGGLTLIGSRAASLTSVQISQLYASSFNNDKKLLTFSDSVQDAAHRAGFFGARTYRFNFRGALQQYVQTAGEGRTLAELPSLFIQHWSDRMGNETYITTFIAPNMLWFADYEALLETGRVPDSSRLRQTDLPATVGQVLSSLEPVNPGTFPYTLLRFIETHQTELFDRFVEMFAQELTPDSIQHLHTFVEGDQEQQAGLQYRIVDGLRSLVRERDSLRKKIRTLQDKIRRKEKEPVQDKNTAQDLGELKQERNALQELVRRLNDCETLQFFTDQGLLPNYAFPEAGVQLQSIIYSKRESVQDGERRYETKIYEYVRPAASAIEELAPANHFYAGGRRVQVDQVDMAVSEIQTWRLCDNCSYMELVGKEDEKPVCPSCGSRLWADAGQKRPLLRMRQVFATTANQQSLIGDDSDDREPTFYTTQMLVNFDERDITDAYSVENDGLPFGFEFLSRATFREINFGEKGETGESVTIAGVALPRQGFPLCRVCGKIQNNPEKPSHALTCVARDQSSEKNLTDCVYLYLEFTSEAIRILLPVTTFAGSERKLHSFVAALQLGLKRQFSGNIDHLHVTTCDEPIADSSYSKKYLVLYDTVPGGTGYLKQLMRSEAPLLDVFEYALAALRACSCNQDPNKDGCYRCLFAYRRSYTMPATSRETAVEVLSDILLYRDALVKVSALRNVSVNALFDSELEARFIEALRRTGPDEDVPVSLSKELVNGKPGYFFKIGERAYYIEPQVTLGTTEGVPVACKADFVFRPARAQGKTLPIAVFTDGYRYHQDRVGHDLAQRMAIVSSGRFHVWSLTWKDVENRYRPQGDYFQNYLNPHAAPNGANFSQLLDGYQLDAFRDVHTKDSFTWLLRFLERPAADPWRQYAFVHGLLMLDPPRFSSPAAIQEWTGRIDEILPDDISTLLNEIGEPRLYGWSEPRDQAELVVLRLGAVVEAAAIQPPIDPARMLVAACLEDGQISRQGTDFEAVWNGYLRLYNLFQFLPLTIFVSREGLAAGAYAALRLKPTPAMSAAAPSEEWEAIRSVTGPELHTLLAQLEAQACPVPDVGYELVDVEGEIVATAELGWPTLQIAFLTEEEREYEPVFTSAGWRTFPLTELQAVDEAAAAVFTSPDAAALL